ncbi:WAT1-related protein At1g43650 [Lathyrus oleraceus]|uniref:WAT1-related protein n=1 Tax=Pisum sativum TaxID=3888 RepID=A0A9D5GWJ0_PEA|nr:WAT1-related protein At1g43650 [Pisum sativum]KAI5443970.1 hypothetical protein KIW84_012557 [Pisum sativum]
MKSSLLGFMVILEKHKPYVSMIFIQFIYAGMALLSKAAISKGMSPYVFVVYRQIFASLALSPFAYFDSKHGGAPLSCNLLCKLFLVSLVGLTASSNLYYVAINYTSATFAAASTNTIPSITFIMAILIGVETISINYMHGVAKIFGSVLSLSGAIVFALVKGPPLDFIKWHNSENQNHNSHEFSKIHSKGDNIKGSLMMLSANTCWSLWLILQGFIVKQYPAKFRLTIIQCLFSFIQSGILAIAMERNPSAWKIGWDIHLLSVAYCGVIVTAICYWLQVCTIETKGPVFTAMFTPLALVLTAIFSAIWWKETLFWGSIGGTVLLVIGLYSVLWGKNKECVKQVVQEKAETRLECVIQSDGFDKV